LRLLGSSELNGVSGKQEGETRYEQEANIIPLRNGKEVNPRNANHGAHGLWPPAASRLVPKNESTKKDRDEGDP
jgi:hypothetical protein